MSEGGRGRVGREGDRDGGAGEGGRGGAGQKGRGGRESEGGREGGSRSVNSMVKLHCSVAY